MKKWICKVCGYTHEGEEAPDRCPQCGASKSQFYQMKEPSGCAFGMLFAVLIVVAFFFTFFSCRSTLTADNSVVHTVDLNQYLGQWYEIARFDHRFERSMTHCTATYTMQEDGRIMVVNQGMKKGKWKTSVGKAKLSDEPGVLRVSFFGPFYSDYRILMIAPDYSYALVGGGSDKYLWILSRTPQMKPHHRDAVLREAAHRGYDTSQLIWVEQKDR